MILRIDKINDDITPSIHNITRALSSSSRRRILISMAQKFVEMARSNFGQSGGQYKDGNWPSLSKSYAKRIGSATPTLKRSGALYNSIKIGTPRMDYIVVSSKSPYMATHTFGSKSRNIPKRNPWPVQFTTPSYSRLLFNAEKNIIIDVGKRLNIMSSGQLPRITSLLRRSTYEYGNVFTATL